MENENKIKKREKIRKYNLLLQSTYLLIVYKFGISVVRPHFNCIHFTVAIHHKVLYNLQN